MDYSFSAVIDDNTFRIELKPNIIQKEAIINEMPHKHFFMEFHYLFSGSERILLPLENKTVFLEEGQMALIPSHLYHGTESDPGETVERICFHFYAETEPGKQDPLIRLLRSPNEVLVASAREIGQTLLRCRELLEKERGPFTETQEGLFLLDAVLAFFRLHFQGKSTSVPKTKEIKQKKWIIEEYLENSFAKNEGLEGLSQMLYLTPRQTRKLVRRFFGEDFKTLLIRRRMETAALLLKQNKKTLEEIAAKVGYTSYSGFHLAFVRFFGCTPGEYRKKYF